MSRRRSWSWGPSKRSWSWGPETPDPPSKAADLAARFENAVAVAMTVPIPATWDPEHKP